MRMILVGVMVAMVGVGGPAFGSMDARCAPAEIGGTVHFTNPTEHVIVERRHNAGTEFGLAVAASVTSILYFPVRFVIGVTGAELGGIGGWTTGGDMRTAKGIWRPTTEGHYFVRPDYFDGTERFRFCGAVPPRHETEYVATRTSVRTEAVPGGEVTVAEPLDSAPYDDSALDEQP